MEQTGNFLTEIKRSFPKFSRYKHWVGRPSWGFLGLIMGAKMYFAISMLVLHYMMTTGIGEITPEMITRQTEAFMAMFRIEILLMTIWVFEPIIYNMIVMIKRIITKKAYKMRRKVGDDRQTKL